MKKVIGKNIVIKSIEEEVRTEAGLILSAKDVNGFRYKKGLVVMPGTEVLNILAGTRFTTTSQTHLPWSSTTMT